MAVNPETHYFEQTTLVPNSKLPVLIYRDVLPQPYSEEKTQAFLEKNQWLKGGTWGAVPRHHFHPNTHECYAVFQGSSTLLLGVGPNEDAGNGGEVFVKAGDVIILPAGVSHCSKDFQDGYRYVGVYPKGAPKWKSEYCRDGSRCQELREEAEHVEIPDWDPVRGRMGPLYELWSS
ncbi:uncharacterized protein F4822DRAFT_316371 [Hypoxylon trugodes]|uniref:uncharacterized protein n=1 Tax=Hypoxylon trugodes TaxID=326681 RepID=UPI0021A0F51A|nr:uncharacterized protein F4822DRAFT_316371 [Hypoxylon trugodes]KAI1386434.1 hypothetical protein F4822DRAFT_316371 [Hypoxylon trugodes]